MSADHRQRSDAAHSLYTREDPQTPSARSIKDCNSICTPKINERMSKPANIYFRVFLN
jgi:hypothetical protein